MSNHLNVAMIGKGNVGRPLGALFEQTGHSVAYATRENVRATLERAQLAVLAVPFPAALALADDPAIQAALAGQILIDATNPFTADMMRLTVGHTTSAAEEIARRVPKARVVKAFNTIFAGILQRRAERQPVAPTVLVASDHADARDAVLGLARSFGFSATDAGALSNARYIEPMAGLLVQLGYVQKMGGEIGFALV
jgi:predicted dinucleotide-binding enzyme